MSLERIADRVYHHPNEFTLAPEILIMRISAQGDNLVFDGRLRSLIVTFPNGIDVARMPNGELCAVIEGESARPVALSKKEQEFLEQVYLMKSEMRERKRRFKRRS